MDEQYASEYLRTPSEVSRLPITAAQTQKLTTCDLVNHQLDRLDFNLRTKPAQLELEQLRQNDEGDFRCRVDFKRGRTVNTIISLRIIIPPSGLSLYMVDGGGHRTFKDLADQEQDHHETYEEQTTGQARQQQLGDFQNRSLVRLPAGGLIGPFDEESELELVCLAHGGKPRPQLSWRRDLRVLNSTNFLPAYDRDSTGISFRLASLEREHLLSIFTCQASNNNLTDPLQSSITLDLNRKCYARVPNDDFENRPVF